MAGASVSSAGYPESSRSGDAISGLQASGDFRIYHAGTRKNDEGVWETHGGRVLAVVSGGHTREEAVEKAHKAADLISFSGLQRRSDIGILHFD
jgi:phosphoribosylamine---glycine ligase